MIEPLFVLWCIVVLFTSFLLTIYRIALSHCQIDVWSFHNPLLQRLGAYLYGVLVDVLFHMFLKTCSVFYLWLVLF